MEKMLNPKEAAQLLGVSVQTLNVWRCTKRYDLPYTKIGRLIRYRESDLSRFVDQRSRGQAHA